MTSKTLVNNNRRAVILDRSDRSNAVYLTFENKATDQRATVGFGDKYSSGTKEVALEIIQALSDAYNLGFVAPEPTTLEQFRAIPIGAKFTSSGNRATTYTKVDDDRFLPDSGVGFFSVSTHLKTWATSSATKLTLVKRTPQDFKDEFAALGVGDQFTIKGLEGWERKAIKVDDDTYYNYETSRLIKVADVTSYASIVKN